MTFLEALKNRWIQLAAGVLLALTAGFLAGHHQKTLEVRAAQAPALERQVAQVAKAGAATAAVDRQAGRAQAEIREHTTTLLQKVPAYVPPEADDRCIVAVGAVRVLDAAARGVDLPAAPGGLPTADSGVALSDLVAGDVANAGSYRDLAARLKAWDDWYDAQAVVARGQDPLPP